MRVALKFSSTVHLREICGHDEQLVTNTDSRNAIRLLQALVEQPDDTEIAALPVSDRDLLMAELYIDVFGPNILSTATCRSCDEKFDLNFSLRDMLNEIAPRTSEKARLLEGAMFELTDGTRFCLPTGADELALGTVPADRAEQLLADRCAEGPVDPEALQEILDEIAPLLSLDLDAVCPECETEQKIRFSIQNYFLTALMQERQHLTYEVHRIASGYGWSLNEIMSLKRSDRKQYTRFIEKEIG